MYIIDKKEKINHKVYYQTKTSSENAIYSLINSRANKIIYSIRNSKDKSSATAILSQVCILNGIYIIYL